MGHESRAGGKAGKDGDEDDQVDVCYYPERPAMNGEEQ